MTLMSILVSAAGLLVGFIVLRSAVFLVSKNKFPLQVNKRVLSVDEQNFLKCLERALGDEYYIMPRVRFLDISHFSQSASAINQYVVNKRIANICADFVLCRKNDLSILGVVELEKFSKTVTPKQKESREKVLASVCRAMDIKLFYFDGRQDYTGMDICRLITGRARTPNTRKVVSADPSMVSVEESSMMYASATEKKHSCPKCYSDVVTKIAVKGDNIGEKFLMCRKYPYCDYQVPVKDAVVKEMQRKEDVSRSKAGYRNW